MVEAMVEVGSSFYPELRNITQTRGAGHAGDHDHDRDRDANLAGTPKMAGVGDIAWHQNNAHLSSVQNHGPE